MSRLLLIAAVLLAGGARAQQPLPTYPGTENTRIGGDLTIAGELYRIGYFTTADSPQKVAAYFVKQWQAEGLPVTRDGDFTEEGVVSAFYTRQGLMRSVVVRVHSGKTLGFAVLKDLWLKQPPAPQVGPIEGTLAQSDIASRGEDGSSQHRAILVDASLDTTRTRLQAAYLKSGFTLIRESNAKRDGREERVLEFTRGRQQAVAVLVTEDGTITAVEETFVGSDRPDAVPNDTAVDRARALAAQEKAR
jgi:hypothetical protein